MLLPTRALCALPLTRQLFPPLLPQHARLSPRLGTRLWLPVPGSTHIAYHDLLKKATQQFAAGVYTQFLIDMRAVRLHRMLADDQRGGNLPVAVAAQQQFTHL